MKQNNKKVLGVGHLQGHLPTLEELENTQYLKPLRTGEVSDFCSDDKPLSSSPVYIHPQIAKFYKRYGTDYIK